ncbi:MAG: hypothetical protein U9P44_00380 [archaeon]|nr:hypothetical protein [archaeon]
MKQNITRKIIEKVAGKIPPKYFAGAMAGFGIAATLGFYAARALANGQCDDPSGVGVMDYTEFLNYTDNLTDSATAAPDIVPNDQIPIGLTDTSAGVDEVLPSEKINAEIYLNGNESVEQLGKQGGLKLDVVYDSGNETISVDNVTEVLPMPSLYDKEMLSMGDNLCLNSSTGQTYELTIQEFGMKGDGAMLKVTNMDTGKSLTEIVDAGYNEALNFGNETLELWVNELFSGEDNKFVELSVKTCLNG